MTGGWWRGGWFVRRQRLDHRWLFVANGGSCRQWVEGLRRRGFTEKGVRLQERREGEQNVFVMVSLREREYKGRRRMFEGENEDRFDILFKRKDWLI